MPPPQVAAAILSFARNFWSPAEPAWRLRLGEARRLTVKGGAGEFVTVLYPGHRYSPAASATMGETRARNYVLRIPTLDQWRALMG